MRQNEPKKEAGFTFAELAFAMLIMVAGAVVLIDHISVNYRTTATERDRVFAYSKAQAILAEIQGFVDRGQVDAAVDLDVLDDGVVNRTPLTIQTTTVGGPLIAADHVVSGNYQRNGQWVWSRRITVQPFLGLNNRNVRYVTVRVFKRGPDGTDNPMADLSAVINSAGNAFPTTQSFDVYLLAIENIPGWWVFMDSIKPFVESMITDLENRNPGLHFRTHWITKSSFGRNDTYRPYINETNDSYAVIDDVYHYPGRMPAGNASAYYYVPDNMKGRMDVDGVDRNGYDATLNPQPYALADYFNHAMRYPQEVARWQARVDEIEDREQDILAAELGGYTPPPELTDMSKEPTYRMFLEDLNTDPDKYKNALIINLHGELLPMPALRNFSDAAKDPENHPQWRVVTHPEELRTRNNDGGVTDDLRLRMYAYTSNSQYYTANDRMSEPMVVEIMGVNLTDSGQPDQLDSSRCRLENMPGGVLVNGSSEYPSSWQTPKHITDSWFPGEMHYTCEFVDMSGVNRPSFTRIYLFNTPLFCPWDSVNSRGLLGDERSRLYQMDYIPSPVDAGPSFATDLSSVGGGPKNTARWTLEIDNDTLGDSAFVASNGATYNPAGDVVLEIRTRIASEYSLGATAWQTGGTTFPVLNQPDNLSTTYAWWTDSREDVPMTERSQFNGDPRHLPYLDCFAGGDDFPDSYNWYHDNLNNGSEPAATDFGSIDGALLRNRWQSAMACDIPRYFELLRSGLVESACVYTTLTGWSYYYVGIGAEIGYDADNGYPNSIPTNMVPHYGVGNGFVNTVTGARKMILSWIGTPVSNWWCGFPWLGELYPDEMASQWLDTVGGTVPPTGNLPAGPSLNQAFQYNANTAYQVSTRLAYGTTLHDHIQRTGGRGCSAFFNIGTSSTSFRHVSASGNGSLTTVGQEIATNYNMTMPSAAPVSRPFSLAYGDNGGEHWNYAPYSTNRFTGTLYQTYYTHGSGTGSGLVKLVNPSNTSAGYIIVNGIDKTVDSGTTFIAKFAVLSLVHSFFEAGSTSNTLRIPQLARVEIEAPTDITELHDPASIDILFGVEWSRWDGEPYTQTGTYAEDESLLEYVIMYSRDNGDSWLYVQDDTVAALGQRPTNNLYVVADSGIGDETYTWPTPSGSFPEGSYLLRLDCYRQGAQVHYSWHQNKIFIQR